MPPIVGLRFPSPMAQSMGMENRDVLPVTRALTGGPSPYRDFLEGAQTGMGLQSLSPTPADTSVLRERAQSMIAGLRPPEAAPPALEPQIAYSPSTGMFAVNDFVFDERDYAKALESEQYLNRPAPIPGNVAQDWQRVNPQEYAALLEGIRNPSAGTRFKRAFESGGAGLGISTGAVLQFFGAEDLGGRIVQLGQQRQEQLAPFTPEFTDVLKGEEQITDWFVSAVGNAGPSILDSIASAAIGAGIGAAVGSVGGGVGAIPGGATGAVAGLFGKQAFKKAIVEIAKKKANGAVLSAAEKKTLSTAAKIAGATTAAYLSSARTLTGEAYNQMRNAGVDPDDLNARLLAAGSGLLGALPETFVEGKLVLDVLRPKRLPAKSFLGGAGAVAAGAGAYGLAEGTTEAFQTGLGMGATRLAAGETYTPDVLEEFINSFAAGFAVGAPLGGMASIRTNTDGGQATDLTQNKPIKPSVPEAGKPEVGKPPIPMDMPSAPKRFGAQAEMFALPQDQEVPVGMRSLLRTPSNFEVSPSGEIVPSSEPYIAQVQSASNIGQLRGVVEDLSRNGLITNAQVLELSGVFDQLEQADIITQPKAGLKSLKRGPQANSNFVSAKNAVLLALENPQERSYVPIRNVKAKVPESPFLGTFRNIQQEAQGPSFPSEYLTESRYESAPGIEPTQLTFGFGDQPNMFGPPRTYGLTEEVIPEGPKPYGDLFGRANLRKQETYQREADLEVVENRLKEKQQLKRKRRVERAGYKGILERIESAGTREKLTDIVTDLILNQSITDMQADTLKELLTKNRRSINIRTIKDAIIRAVNPPKDLLRGRQQPPGKKPAPSAEELDSETAKPSSEAVATTEQAAPAKPARPKPRRGAKQPATAKAAPADQRVSEEAPVVQDQVEITQGAEDIQDKDSIPPIDPLTPSIITDFMVSELKFAIENWKAAVFLKDKVDAVTQMETWFANDSLNKEFSFLDAQGRTYRIKDFFTVEGKIKNSAFNKANMISSMVPSSELSFDLEEMSKVPEYANYVKLGEENYFGIAWYDKEVALLVGSTATGKPLYFPARSDGRYIAQDVSELTKEPEFTEAQLARLKAAREEQIINDIAYKLLNPNGPFKKGETIIFSDDISPQFKALAKSWISLLKLENVKLVITSSKGAAKLSLGMEGAYKRLRHRFDKRTVGITFTVDSNASAIMLANVDINLNAMEIFAHELGHIVEKQAFNSASQEIKQKIEEEYNLWKDKNLKGSARTLARNLRAFAEARAVKFKPNKTAASLDPYWYSFGEWFADQVSRWATTQEKPLTVVEKFFKRLADRLRTFFTGQKARFLPNATVSEWLNSLSPDFTDQAYEEAAEPEGKPPAGKYFRTDGTPITEPISSGKLKLLASSTVSKFAKKPSVSVVSNVEELKRTNRALYNRALKARPDLDTVAASGVSFGDQIVLFSDNIRTEQEAKFVLAHEALGHFGLRSIMTQEELNTALDDIYENSDNIRYTAQRKMGLYKISQREATEEALSDLAATMDTNVLYRIWSYIKKALTKITGIKFGDEEARRLVWQARRYVRTGNAGVTTAEVMQDGSKEMAVEYDVGMFNRMGAGHAKADIISAFYPSSATSSSNLLDRAKEVFANAKDLKRWLSKGIEQLATADEKTIRSLGYQKAMALYTASARVRQQILTEVEKLTKFTNESSVDAGDRSKAERLLAFANDYARTQNEKREYQKLGNLIVIDPLTGETSVDKDILKKLKKLGRLDLDTAKTGFTAEDVDGVEVKHEPMPDLKEEDAIWKIYNEQRNAVDFMALELLRSVYKEQYNKFNTRLNKIAKLSKTELTEKDIYVLRRVSIDYLDIYNSNAKVTNGKYMTDPESTKKAEAFIVEVLKALHSDEKVKDWQSGNPNEVAGQYQGDKYKYIIESVPRLRSLGISQQKQVDVILPLFQNMALDNVRVFEAELRAKDTIALGYTPRVRRGKFFVRAVPVDAQGKRVFLKSEFEQIIPFSRAENRADREDLIAKLTAAFGDNTYTIPDIDGNEISVRWKIESGEGNTSSSTTEDESPVTLVRQLERYNISLTQAERERLIDAIADFNSAARRSLYRTNNPGWDKNTIRNIAEWVQTFSNIAGKNEYAFLISDVLDDTKLWDGDPELLRRLYKELKDAEATGNQAQIRIAADKFEQYAHQYIVSAPTSSQPIKLGDKVYQGQGQGRRYQEDMKEVLRWFSRSADAVISTEDVLGEKGSALMAGASIMQLGGNVSTAAASLTSLPTHSFSYLAFRNSKRGYGGGFGPAKTMAELSRAISNVTDGLRPNRFTDIGFMEEMVAKGTHAQHGLTADEAVFLLDALSDGTTLAAQANALMDQSVGKIGNNLVRKSVNYWMYMFVQTDALNRRVTALAAYRLYKDRILAAKNNPSAFSAKDIAALQADPDYQYVVDNAKLAVTKAQGEHGAFNRPKIARGTILRYPFMYQQIVVLTIQLMRNLPPAGQLYMLSMIWLTSGLKGVPGEDDFADLFDTLMQFTGQKWEGVDKYLIDMSESILPGSSPYVMRGLVDGILGGSVSIKTGFGDVLPLTGVFRAGADPARELENFAGPVWAAYAGLVGTGTSTLKWAGSSLGMGDKEVTLVDILRDSPVSGLKAVADGLVYMDTGQVINSRGEVLSEDLTAGVIASRMLGFYPAEATVNYDVLRISRNLSEYNKAIKAEYVLKYKRAKAYGDAERVRQVIQEVRDWNASARGTSFEIRDFVSSAERAYREAQKPVAARFLRTVSKTNQQTTEELMAAMGID